MWERGFKLWLAGWAARIGGLALLLLIVVYAISGASTVFMVLVVLIGLAVVIARKVVRDFWRNL
jgi:hypothetical protein